MTLPSRGDPIALLAGLVRVDSRNPSLCPDAPGEGEVARYLADVLTAWGMRVELQEVVPGRYNVIARVGPATGRRLMFNGHLDVVGVNGMVHAAFDASVRDGRMYGRGTSDMKGGVAAMCAAAARASDHLKAEVIIAAVVDEEFESLGTRALIASGVRADAVIVTEPTRLNIGPAHRGFTWVELVFTGRAAHGSRYDLGVDAIMHAAAVLGELDRFNQRELTTRTHPLLGHASLHASTIAGGSGWSTYPDRCVVRIERRTLPGESQLSVIREFEEACARVASHVPDFACSLVHVLSQSPSDVAVSAPVVTALGRALGDCQLPHTVAGVSAWTDAALFNAAGIPAICFGPGDMGLAHADEEFIHVAEVEQATRVLELLALHWHTVS